MSSSVGTLFTITTFGESHGSSVGVVIDGCPPGFALCTDDIQLQLNRRRPGQSSLTTDRKEGDRVQILSGTEQGKTLGTPIALKVDNSDQRPADYGETGTIPRPSHADYTYQMKYGIRAASGGGRASARETIGSVAAGAVADKILKEKFGIEIVAWVESVETICADSTAIDKETIHREEVDKTTVRCPDIAAAKKMTQLISQLKEKGDSTGGTIRCVIRNIPAGVGEPVFDKLEARLAQAMLAIPATKGFEVGSGFAGSQMRGSQHNDPFIAKDSQPYPATNNSGGIQGGLTNGAPVDLHIAFKPPATIALPQKTVDFKGNSVVLEAKGRHDPCVVPRAVPIVESMAALAVLDLLMQQEAREAVCKQLNKNNFLQERKQ